jgi:hypothetical protein
MPNVLQRPLDAGIAPGRILGGHPHDERTDARLQPDAPSAGTAVRPLPAHQLPIHRRMVSGVTRVTTRANSWRPRRWPSSARRRARGRPDTVIALRAALSERGSLRGETRSRIPHVGASHTALRRQTETATRMQPTSELVGPLWDTTGSCGPCSDSRFPTLTVTGFLMYWNRYLSKAYHRYRSPIIPRCRPRFTRDIAVDE